MPTGELVELIDESARRFGDRPALLGMGRYRTQVWSYMDLRDASARAARHLAEAGVEQGDRVVMWARNSPYWVIAFFGILRRGAVAVPLDMQSTWGFVARVLDRTEPRLAIVSGELPWREYSLPVREVEEVGFEGDREEEDALASSPSQGERESALAEIIFTSGTTGAPKGVTLTQANIAANVRALARMLPARPDDCLVSLLPLSHMFEQTVGLLLPLSGGARVVYPASRRSREVFRAVADHRATALLLVPQVLQLLLDAIEREVQRAGQEARWGRLMTLAPSLPMPLRRLAFRGFHQRLGGRLRFVIAGGARLEPALAWRWEALGVPVLQGYGATEAAPVVSGSSVAGRRIGSVGHPLPGQQLRIASDGEVLIAGPNVTLGYWRDLESTRVAFQDVWYCTGDLGELDREGYLYLKGRKKDLIVLANGMNVYAEDVERELRAEPGVLDAAVLGIEDPSGATQVVGVLLGPPDEAEAAAAVDRANTRLAPHQQVGRVAVWPNGDFPRTSTLKAKKHEVAAWLREGLVPAAGQAPITETGLESILAQRAGGRVYPEARLEADLGLDSLQRLELLVALEDELAVEVGEERLDGQTTVAELERLIAEAPPVQRPTFQRWPLASWACTTRALILEVLLRPVLRMAFRPKVDGLANVQTLSGPVIFAANHASHLDAPALLCALPTARRRRVAVAAAADYFFARRWLGLLVSLVLNAFPFPRVGAMRSTLEWCGRLLDDGWSLLVFPEGTRSLTGGMGPFKPGIGLMAQELEVAVVPVRVRGTRAALPKGGRLPRPGPLRVTFGAPLRFSRGDRPEDATRAIEAAVRGL